MRKYRTIYTSETKIIQQIITCIGDCKMIKYREITREDGKTCSVEDIIEPPTWLLRLKKLRLLGI